MSTCTVIHASITRHLDATDEGCAHGSCAHRLGRDQALKIQINKVDINMKFARKLLTSVEGAGRR